MANKEKKHFKITRRDIIMIFITMLVTSIIILVILFLMIKNMSNRNNIDPSSSESISTSSISYEIEEKINNNLITIINNYYDEYDSIPYHTNKIIALNYDESNLYVSNISEDNIYFNIVTIPLEGEVGIEEALSIIKDSPTYIASSHVAKKISKSINIELSSEYKNIYPGDDKGINYSIVDNLYAYSGINKNNDTYMAIINVIYDNSNNSIDVSSVRHNDTNINNSIYYMYLNYLYRQ